MVVVHAALVTGRVAGRLYGTNQAGFLTGAQDVVDRLA
ncbi:hypothetical protein FB384_002070 [Prauserella sediminis]|uniref:Uncharacterized protein n=1 Tax=Prauserella sediminis TaxID=577680 RepID=A0A839XT49_9PSEU|nr:hypothetical protein [Prauserella sediminis]